MLSITDQFSFLFFFLNFKMTQIKINNKYLKLYTLKNKEWKPYLTKTLVFLAVVELKKIKSYIRRLN